MASAPTTLLPRRWRASARRRSAAPAPRTLNTPSRSADPAALARLQRETQPRAGIVGGPTGRQPERIAGAVEQEIAVAADRAGQRPTSPLKAMSFNSSVPRLAASCSAMRPVRLSRSIASAPRRSDRGRGRPIQPALRVEPEIERKAADGQFAGAHSPRISEPRLNSTSSRSARTRPGSLAPPTTT